MVNGSYTAVQSFLRRNQVGRTPIFIRYVYLYLVHTAEGKNNFPPLWTTNKEKIMLNEVTGIRPETQDKYLEMLEIRKTDLEEYKRKVEALSAFEREEVLWWTQRAEDYLAEHNRVVLTDDETGEEIGTAPKCLGWRNTPTQSENENPDNFDVMDCREDVIDALVSWGHDGGRFHILGTLGNTIYFDYNTEEDSQRIFHRTGHGGQRMRMAMKVQTVDEHERMVALWDLHCSCLSGSREEFIERYYEFRNPKR